jgi:hypothetical protein
MNGSELKAMRVWKISDTAIRCNGMAWPDLFLVWVIERRSGQSHPAGRLGWLLGLAKRSAY